MKYKTNGFCYKIQTNKLKNNPLCIQYLKCEKKLV